jgi:hypothetical protein
MTTIVAASASIPKSCMLPPLYLSVSRSHQHKLLIRRDMPLTFMTYMILERHICRQNRCSKKRVDRFLSLRT